MNHPLFRALALSVFAAGLVIGADDDAPDPDKDSKNGDAASANSHSRIFGIIPNNTSTSLDRNTAKSLTVKEKFALASRNARDPGAFVVAGFFSGIGHINHQYPSFGQGLKGYGNRYVRMYADVVTTEYMTDAVIPALFHQDPRYFRLGEGSTWKRTKYAISRLWLARCDNGKTCFNYGAMVGSTAQVGLSSLYYPRSERTATNLTAKAAIAIGPDAISFVLREFWPDIARKLKRRKKNP
jgi:hypothetical protein